MDRNYSPLFDLYAYVGDDLEHGLVANYVLFTVLIVVSILFFCLKLKFMLFELAMVNEIKDSEKF